MGFLLQITMSCPCALSRQVAGAGAGAVSWLCTRWRQVAGAGAGCQCWCRVPGAGAGAVSWLCTWWGQVAGAGAGCRCRCWCRVPVLVLVLQAGFARGGDRLLVLVPGAGCGPGAGAVSWLCTWWRQVAGVGARCRCRAPGAGAGAGAVSWLCAWWRQVAGVGAGCRCWVPGAGSGAGAVVETGCWYWVPGAGAGAVSRLRMWWRQGAAGCARGGDRAPGAGAGCWLCAWWRGFLFPRTRPLWGSYFFQSTMRTYFCMYNVLCATSGSQPTIISACFSMLHAQ